MSKHSIVESVTKFNGRVLYGCTNDGAAHDQEWLQKTSSGSYKQSGQVAAITDANGVITEVKLSKTRTEAYNWLEKNFVSEGILA